MHVVVTGNTGFIGRQLCNELLKKGHTITALSRNQGNAEPTLQETSMKNIEMINCDILQKDSLQENFKNMGTVDCVFHLAGQTFKKDLTSPYTYFQSNFISTLNMLECCRNFGIKKFVFSSSVAVYGLGVNQFVPKYLPVDENHPVRPYDFYDSSKYHAEELCKFYSDRFGINSAILRYSRVYGPTMGKGLVVQAIKKALSNEPIEVMGDITTDFVFVNDVVRANLASVEKKLPNSEVFNIGSGEEKSLHWVCSTIVDMCQSSSKIIFQQEPKSKFSFDISKARNLLDLEPTATKEGLIECVNYIKNSAK
ncbi:GDP-L-fucose synthase [uncultured archaeon]|nr:GDP-L-fucose synthase [uncultured archaeon]